jgi:acyl-CoA hydrolase
MSSPDWIGLREHLEADFARRVDAIIAAEADPDWRQYLERYRARLIERLADKAELQIMKEHLARRDALNEAAGATMQ